MRLNNRGVRRPLSDEEFSSEFSPEKIFGGNDMDGVVQKISLDKVSLEERRKEAKKPLYLVRYE
jgi:hypothetical protein